MKLGDRIKGVPLRRSRDAYRGKRTWVERSYMPQVEGMYIGYRTYANGHTEGGYDDPVYFVPEEYIKVALLVRDERSKPEAVLFETAQVISQ